MEEIWKDIKGYEGLYQINNYAEIKSLGNKTHSKEHYIKQKIDKDGYKRAHLYKNGIGKTYGVHRLVYEAFIGEIPDGLQVNHINEDKSDNRPENLNLMDCKTNINWGTGIEKRAKQIRKPVYQMTLSGEIIKKFDSVNSAAKELGLRHVAISKCCLNRPHCNTSGGFRWKFAE